MTPFLYPARAVVFFFNRKNRALVSEEQDRADICCWSSTGTQNVARLHARSRIIMHQYRGGKSNIADAISCFPKFDSIFHARTILKLWPNGTPKSSQVEPSWKNITYIGWWPKRTAKSSQLARNQSIVGIRPRSHIITKQLGESWLELAEVAKRWKTWLELGENLSLITFKPTRANSSQVGGQTIPNSIEVVNFARVGLTWEDHLARA